MLKLKTNNLNKTTQNDVSICFPSLHMQLCIMSLCVCVEVLSECYAVAGNLQNAPNSGTNLLCLIPFISQSTQDFTSTFLQITNMAS